MVKRIAVIGLALLGAWSCATLPSPAPPAFFVEDLPAEATTRLRLDDRIAAEDAWDALKSGRPELARKYLMKLGTANPIREAGLAYADLLSADFAAAEARFKSSIAGTPDMIPSRVGLAQIYESRRERDKAFAEYKGILELDPGNRWAAPRYRIQPPSSHGLDHERSRFAERSPGRCGDLSFQEPAGRKRTGLVTRPLLLHRAEA